MSKGEKLIITDTIEIEWLSSLYRATYHHGSEVVQIEELTKSKYRKPKYETVYFGHLEPLERMMGFFKRRSAQQDTLLPSGEETK